MQVKLPSVIRKFVNIPSKYTSVSISRGLKTHIIKKHPNCLQYLPNLPSMISNPDYVGINPKEASLSFELVKVCKDNVLIGIKLDVKKDELYVASVYDITSAKLQQRISNSRLQKI